MKSARYLTGAREELDDAIDAYEQQREDRGKRFREAVTRAIAGIQRFPKAYPKHNRSGCRECRVHRFPYALYYQETDDEIVIVAVSHGKRRPGYWRKRLKRRIDNRGRNRREAAAKQGTPEPKKQ